MKLNPDTPLKGLYAKGMLSTRAYNALAGNYDTLGEVLHIPEDELLRTPNFGKVSLKEVKTLREKCPKPRVNPVVVELRALRSRISALESSIGVLRQKLAEHQNDLMFLFRGFKK